MRLSNWIGRIINKLKPQKHAKQNPNYTRMDELHEKYARGYRVKMTTKWSGKYNDM